MYLYFNVFCIVGDEVELPPTVQEQLLYQFDEERRVLQSKIESLALEKEQSQLAFDRFRERARVSLIKTANDQQSFDNEMKAIRDQLKVEKEYIST